MNVQVYERTGVWGTRGMAGKPLTPVRFLVIGAQGGLLQYVRAWATEQEAQADQERVGKEYGIEYTEDDGWHDDENDVWIATDDGTY